MPQLLEWALRWGQLLVRVQVRLWFRDWVEALSYIVPFDHGSEFGVGDTKLRISGAGVGLSSA